MTEIYHNILNIAMFAMGMLGTTSLLMYIQHLLIQQC